MQAERYNIEVSFQPEKGFLHARAAVTLRALERLDAIEFELNPRLKILEVSDTAGRKLEFERSGRLGSPMLSVHLAAPIEPRKDGPQTISSPLAQDEVCPPPAPARDATGAGCLTLTFTYEGILPRLSLDYITHDGILLRDESRWYPAVDLSAFTLNEIATTLPDDWWVVSSGEPVSLTRKESTGTIREETGRAVSSRSIAAGPLALRSVRMPSYQILKDFVSLSMRACASRGQFRPRSAIEARICSVWAFFTALLGPGDNDALTIAEGFPGQRGVIAYSAPGFLVLSKEAVESLSDSNDSSGLLPHEIAHQWSPIGVTIARQEDGWLAESLAEYLAWRYLDDKHPAQARQMVTRALRDALAPQPLRPLSLGLRLFAQEENTVAHATLYSRGMLVWRTLEAVMDRERMDRALREYFKRDAGRSASIADFRRICEEISGRDLSWFFHYYLDGTEVPVIELRRSALPAPENEADGEILVKNAPPDFAVPIEIEIETPSGPLRYSVEIHGAATPFAVTAPKPITGLALDPDRQILHHPSSSPRPAK